MKRFTLYLLRWQASTIILAPCIAWLAPLGPIASAAIANLIGGVIFYFVDRRIFKEDTK
jgi:hypothetical protein